MKAELIMVPGAAENAHLELQDALDELEEADQNLARQICSQAIGAHQSKQLPWASFCFFPVNYAYATISAREGKRGLDRASAEHLSSKSKFIAVLAAWKQSNAIIHVDEHLAEIVSSETDIHKPIPAKELLSTRQFAYAFSGRVTSVADHGYPGTVTMVDDRTRGTRCLWPELIVLRPINLDGTLMPHSASLPLIDGLTYVEAIEHLYRDTARHFDLETCSSVPQRARPESLDLRRANSSCGPRRSWLCRRS